MKNKAFTLTELLIALAVIGVLIAILLPVISNLMPDQNAIMAKRAYHGVQTVTSSLINDEACYPNKTYALGDEARVGFDDGYGYADCTLWGGVENQNYIDEEDANSKFLTLFTNKLDLNTNDSESVLLNGATTYQFTTKDKMIWTAQNMNLASTNTDPSIELMIDVNGADKPNCASATQEGCANKKDFDRFTVKIHADGKLDILEDWALEAVGVDADVTGSNK
ncbi:prepilin-type N-terminal cleavage/methylation domain-containing protein [bacterium]|nr:prepilin-type N-terminal cleavage/methylation domain-containing protein [bacterium]